jgi:hypothetical protein
MEYFARQQKSRPRGHLPQDFAQNDKRLSKVRIHLYNYFPIGKPRNGGFATAWPIPIKA